MEQLTLPDVRPLMLGWYDPDKKVKMKQKILDATTRYEEKFGKPATVVLTHPEHVAEAQAATDILVEGRSYIGRFTFYVGEE